ncbi:MAG: radical SAM protein, partial [Candidatus Coatesbacteria bacterium]|nr:radical SAM protein [Candidatus Coatesbacteria bacterium]
MQQETIFWKLFGRKLLSYKLLADGNIVGTGLLNPLSKKLGLLIMLYLQANFYRQYPNLGTWQGRRVSNPFAPPVGSRPQFRALKGLLKKELFGRPSPIAMTFAVTYKCPCRCVHCSAGNHLRSDVPELSTEEAKQLIDDSQDLGVTIIAFTGGEPLLRPDIYELISHVNPKKAMPIMFTNGLLLTDENAERLAAAGLYTLFVSIDSPVAEEHDSLREMPGLFETAVTGLQKLKAKGVFVGISSYATRSATERGLYKQLYALAQELRVDDMILFDAVPTGNLLHDTSQVLTPEQRVQIREYSEAVFRDGTMPPFCSQSWQNSVEGYLSGIGCLAANIQFYASAYGDIAPCDFTPLSFG